MRFRTVVFDVNETLSDTSAMGGRFADVGAPEHLGQLWFTSVLRDGFAVTVAGDQQPFAVIGEQVLRGVLASVPLNRDVDAAVDHVMAGFGELPTHPDVVDGIRRLRASGRRLMTLSNGSTSVAEALLTKAGIADHFDQLLSVEDAEVWKPGAGAYRYAAQRCGESIGDMLLVAVHPWDVNGAARAGMATAWVNRSGAPYPGFFARPDVSVADLRDLVAALDAVE
ncbi:MAG: haloacid dehalogenase type II [Actinomycetota bacterium]|nr:haloacid dehalogenase type II [Actinomycetota bacterium]